MSSSFQPGDLVWYFKPKRSSSEDEEAAATTGLENLYSSVKEAREAGVLSSCLLVEIKAIHYDDFPSIYYTIGMLADEAIEMLGRDAPTLFFDREKQTTRTNLIPRSSSNNRTSIADIYTRRQRRRNR